MSRLRLFMQGVASTYLAVGTTVACSLISVPLALHYLTDAEFGLWMLLAQITGYLMLLDFGLSLSVGRLLIERKDEIAGTGYGSLLQTSFWVTAAQAVLVLGAGVLSAPFLAKLLDIPRGLETVFCSLVRWQSLIAAGMFGTRMFRSLLYAHQRTDLVNCIQSLSMFTGVGALWLALLAGTGVRSVLWWNAATQLLSLLITWWSCARLRLFPAANAWGRASWLAFKELFGYGKDVFIVQVGSLLIMATQPFIVSRAIGLEAVAAWFVGTRAFMLISSLIWQAFDVSAPALSEMMVRGEDERLRKRFSGIVVVLQVLAGVGAIVYAATNSSFVTIWTHGRISWSPWNDVLLGVWMIVLALVHTNCGFVVLTKRIGNMRYVYLLEGVAFVVLASLATPAWGFPAVLGTSVLCSLCFSCAYGMRRTNQYFRLRLPSLERLWLAPLGRIFVVLIPTALALLWLTASLTSMYRFPLLALVLGSLGGLLFLRLGIPVDLRAEILQRAPEPLRRLMREKLGQQHAGNGERQEPQP